MKLLLQAHEGVICGLGELDVAEDGAGDVWPHVGCLRLDRDALHLVLGHVEHLESRRGHLSPEHIQAGGDTLKA